MTLRLGDDAPDFMADTTEGEISFENVEKLKPYLRYADAPKG